MSRPLTTLEQWRTALAVADAGSFAAAAKALHKSQSTVSHAISELNARLPLPVFEIVGRRSEITPSGAVLLRRARRLLDDAQSLEQVAAALAQGLETTLTIAVDAIVPMPLVVGALRRFAEAAPHTRVEVQEVVLSGVLDVMAEGSAALALSATVPPGFRQTELMKVRFVPVAQREHPLHRLGRPVDYDDMRHYRQLIVRDSGRRRYDSGWLEAEMRWTFSNLAGSIEAMKAGTGFAWLPRHKITEELATGVLKELPLARPEERLPPVYLITPDPDTMAPGARMLADAFLAEADGMAVV